MKRKSPDTPLHVSNKSLSKLQVCDDLSRENLIHELQVHQTELEMQNEELRRTETRLADVNAKYTELFQFAPVGYFIFDEQGKVLEVNITATRMLGSNPVNKHFQKFISPEFHKTFYLHRRNVLQSGQKDTCKLRLTNDIYVSLESVAEPSETGNFRSTMTDITVLHKSEETYRLLFELNVIGIFRRILDLADNRYELLDCNDAHARILGYSSREELKNIGMETSFVSKKVWTNYIESLIRDRRVVNYRANVRQKNGNPIWVLINASARDYNKNGELLIEGTITDITEQKRTETRLRSTQRNLRAMASEIVIADERSRQNFAADLHDSVVQTLGAAKLRSELLKEYISPKGSVLFSELKNLIVQSITQSRFIMAELSPPVLNELGFVSAIEWLTEQIESQHDIPITFESACHFIPLVHELQVLLFQATRELLMNVVKHARATEVKVKLGIKGKTIRIEVHDNGIGFNKNKTYRTDSSSGFGLFSVRERLKHFGGQLIIHSKPHEGSRVVVICPTGGGVTFLSKKKNKTRNNN